MLNAIERTLEVALTDCRRIGQIAIRKLDDGGVALSHREDETRDDLKLFHSAEDAIELSKFDDAGNYRSLKTAPNLRHGWRLDLATLDELKRSLDYFYPGRLAVFAAWKNGQLRTTPLRDTLDRQSANQGAGAVHPRLGPERREPAEGRPGEVARARRRRAHRRRTDARHRRRGTNGHLRPARSTGRGRSRHSDDFLGSAGSARHERSDPRHAPGTRGCGIRSSGGDARTRPARGARTGVLMGLLGASGRRLGTVAGRPGRKAVNQEMPPTRWEVCRCHLLYLQRTHN